MAVSPKVSVVGGVLLLLLLLPLFVISALGAPNEPPSRHRVRAADRALAELIEKGYERSQTFRQLVEAIEQSDAMVVVQYGFCRFRMTVRACISNVTTDHVYRHIRIKIDSSDQEFALIARIAHELQHALEIIADPAARDTDSVLAMYRRIGNGECGKGLSDRCDTEAARSIERIVRKEIAIAPPQRTDR